MTVTNHETDLEDLSVTPIRNKEETEFSMDRGYKKLPFDFPISIRLVRHMHAEKGLLGWSLQFDILMCEPVVIKIAKGGGFEIHVDGNKIYKGTRRTSTLT